MAPFSVVPDPEVLASWPRPNFQPGGGSPHLFYKIHGSFRGTPEISRLRHRCAGVPAGCTLRLHSRKSDPSLLELGLGSEWCAGELRRENPGLAEALRKAEQCLVLAGELSDPANLDYFRDAVGLVMALVESGGIGVFDPHMFKWWAPEEWRRYAFDPAAAVPRHHVVILVSEESEPGLKWYHTRGMRKFGRPDLSVHNVAPEIEAGVEDLLNRFIELLAFGAVVPDGQAIKMASLPQGWRCFHRGTLEDPDFNNKHLEIGPRLPSS